MKLEITEILSFYELPQIVVARNVFGTQFLLLLESDETELGIQYLSVPISTEKLNFHFLKFYYFCLLILFYTFFAENAILN